MLVSLAVAGGAPAAAVAASQEAHDASAQLHARSAIVVTHPRRAAAASKRKVTAASKRKAASASKRRAVAASKRNGVAASKRKPKHPTKTVKPVVNVASSPVVSAPAAIAPATLAAVSSLSIPVQPMPAPQPPAPAPSAPGITGVTYYVSPSGSDSNVGTSPAQAWRTVARVNAAHLNPGDGVLFEGGQTFSDQVLMPSVSGAAQAPIVFGSYGQGSATITQGAWFVQNDLAFEDLAFSATVQGGSAVKGTSDGITLDGVSISLPAGNHSLGLYANGDDWVIENSQISNTGLSGMLLNGNDYLITDNAIDDVGLDTTNGYNNHGIYLDASDATITGNTITNFADSAVSVRYHNSTIDDNTFSGGQIGIDFYEYDTIPGSSAWTNNTITGTTVSDIFVCGTAEGCREPLENFTINANQLSRASGVYTNLQPTSGNYTLSGNALN
jgi:putative cofactor-binding repeat protein